MGKWVKGTVETACEILDNKRIPLSGKVREGMKGSIPYYGANGLVGFVDKYIFDDDLILIAEDGGNFEQYEQRPVAYKISGKSWVNNHAHILKSLVDFSQDYIFYCLEHVNVLNYVVGGTRSKLNQRELRRIEIYYPENHVEQEKIAEILSIVDVAIEKTKALIEKYKNIKEGLLTDLMTNGIDKNGNIRSPETHKYKDSPLGMIPVEWACVSLDNFVNDANGIVAGPFGSDLKVSDYCDEGIPLIRLQNVGSDVFINKDIIYISKGKANQLKRHSFLSGDIILAKLGIPIGKTALVPEDFPMGIVVADVVRIRQNDKVFNKYYLMFILNTDICRRQLNSERIGTTRPRVNISQLKKIWIKRPPKKEQDLIGERISSIQGNILQEEKHMRKLESIKKGLMQDLLTHKVSVDCLL